jgi:hypothetical protein
MARLVADQATAGESRSLTPLIDMRIMTRSASHLGLREALAHRQSGQLVTCMNAANALCRGIAVGVKFRELIPGPKLECALNQGKSAGVALCTNVELAFPRKLRRLDDVPGGLIVWVGAMVLDMLLPWPVAAFA